MLGKSPGMEFNSVFLDWLAFISYWISDCQCLATLKNPGQKKSKVEHEKKTMETALEIMPLVLRNYGKFQASSLQLY